MAQMRHPDMQMVDVQDWSSNMTDNLNNMPIKQVYLNEKLSIPDEGMSHGGITNVPFITINCSGQASAIVSDLSGDQWVSLSSGTAIVHLPGTFTRTYYASPGSALRFTCDTDHVLCGRSQCLVPELYDNPAGYPPMEACIYPSVLSEPAPSLLEKIMTSSFDQMEARCAWLSAWLWQLCYDLRGGNQAQPSMWLAMRAWLEEHCSEDIGRSDCASEFNVHPNHVARLFKQHAGASFTDTLLQLRLRKARLLLRQTTLSVQEIGERCAFNDTSYFIRRFREQLGLSPDKWRRGQ